MPKLTVLFQHEISVPMWEHCNEQKDSQSKNGDYYCSFLTGSKDERGCRLFNESLYSCRGWVKKCDKCIEKSKVEGIQLNKKCKCNCEISNIIKNYQNEQCYENKIKINLKQQIKDYIYKHKHHAMYYDDEGSIGAKSLLDYLELL
jgi:hypothetical protein